MKEHIMSRLQGKTAVVTGGGTGIGLGAAKRFVDEGAFVCVFGRRQEPLDAAVAQLRLSVEACPESVVCGGTAAVRVRLENGSGEELGSFPPFPLQLSYRWLAGDDSEVGGPEALRTALKPALGPHQAASYVMTIAAPAEPGRYRLRVTLVQELVRWLDGLPYPVSADAPLVVVPSLTASTTAPS